MTDFKVKRRSAENIEQWSGKCDPLMAQVYAARGAAPSDISYSFQSLLAPSGMMGMSGAVARIADAVTKGESIVCSADYDADGCGAGVLVVAGLRSFGAAKVDYMVPDRFTMGYGLSPPLVDIARDKGADLIVTVDNGIAAFKGIEYANDLGIDVVVTDHHLAADEAPDALAIVNPNQHGCEFGSKNLAGVGVAFYTLWALRDELIARNWFNGTPPSLAVLLDVVAMSTVADVVKLDYNNRILVRAGLERIRRGQMRPGIRALFEVSKDDPRHATAASFGFKIAPRINASGRLEDISMGIECLLCEDYAQAYKMASQLDELNRARRDIEADMREVAEVQVSTSDAVGLVCFSEDWHEGVVGLVAGRIKEQEYRPTIAFAKSETGRLKGSGRSIPGLHLRDVLAEIDGANPGLLGPYGGHAHAIGCSVSEENLETFKSVFDEACRRHLSEDQLGRVIETDGEVRADDLSFDLAVAIENGGPWGQGFPEPLFESEFSVVDAKAVGEDQTHARYRVRAGGQVISAIHFGGAENMIQPGGSLPAIFKPGVNRWNGRESLDVQIIERLD